MPESSEHKMWKNLACGCGKSARPEYRLAEGSRLDCLDEGTKGCAEVEFTRHRIPRAVERLETARRLRLCDTPRLVVKPQDYSYAEAFVRGKGIEVIPADALHLADAVSACLILVDSRRASEGVAQWTGGR